MNNKATILIIVVLALAATAYTAAFVVDETEQVVLTRFGKIVRKPITTPGLNFRIPFIDTVNKYPLNLQHWDGDPGQIPTLDKTFIWVDAFARWKITDPVKLNGCTQNPGDGRRRAEGKRKRGQVAKADAMVSIPRSIGEDG